MREKLTKTKDNLEYGTRFALCWMLMSDLRPEIEETSIVVLGSFNPEIFQPEWFLRQGLVREKATSKVNIVHPEATSIEIDNIKFDVTRQRFQAKTNNPEFYEPIRDIVIGSFSILIHDPLRAVGLNRSFHYKAPSEEAWHNIGDKLAPKDVWNKYFIRPGMCSLTINGNRKLDDSAVLATIRVEPSARIKPSGIFIALNYHFDLLPEKEEQRSALLIDSLKNHWRGFFFFSNEVSKSILDLM